jgi:hypothetical protein
MRVSSKTKGIHEAFARFFEHPSRESFRDFLATHLGEFSHVDFKREWPAWDKVARHVLALANSEGGCLISGVSQRPDGTLEPTGLERLADKANVTNGIKKYVPESVLRDLDVLDFNFEAAEYPAIVGRQFQIVIVEDEPKHLPVVAQVGSENLRANAIYVRRGAASEEASHEEVQRIISRRVETAHSSAADITLEGHLAQLKILYSEFKPRLSELLGAGLIEVELQQARRKNPSFPSEAYHEFVGRMIRIKQKMIEALVMHTGRRSTPRE